MLKVLGADSVIGDHPLCGVGLQLELVTRLGDEDGPGALIASPYAVTMDSRGRYYVLASSTIREPVKVFNHDGSFLTALGRIGEGPGEYQMPAVVLILPGDTVSIFDMGNRRLTVLSPEYEVVHTLDLPRRINMSGAVLLGVERFGTNFDLTGTDSVAAALQIMDRGGFIIRTFSNEQALSGAGPPQFGRTMRSLSGSRDGLWSAPMFFEYRLEQWDTAGRRLKAFLRRPPWFQPYDTLLARSPEYPPSPVVAAIREDRAGRLWSTVLVADSQWAEGLGDPIAGEGGQTHYQTEDVEATLDTYLEIFAPSGRLLVSRRFDRLFAYLIADSLIGRALSNDAGIPLVEIYRVTLSP